jgi:hypothetical protein
MTTDRQNLIRNVRRVLADLNGGRVWKWNLARLRDEADYTLDVRREGLASDEIRNLEAFLKG